MVSISSNVGIAIITHPPFITPLITIFMGGKSSLKIAGFWHCYTHMISHDWLRKIQGLSFEERLCSQVRKDRMACPAATWQKLEEGIGFMPDTDK